MNLIQNMPLANTLGLASYAQYGCLLSHSDDVVAARAFAQAEGLPFRVIGAGSNIVPMAQVRGVVGVMAITTRRIIDEGDTGLQLEVGAGHNWHELVLYSVDQGWFGIENLALIPGSVGAAPVQNIGAYGVELAEVIAAVQVLDGRGDLRWLSTAECGFGYRSSRFQQLLFGHLHRTLLWQDVHSCRPTQSQSLLAGHPGIAVRDLVHCCRVPFLVCRMQQREWFASPCHRIPSK